MYSKSATFSMIYSLACYFVLIDVLHNVFLQNACNFASEVIGLVPSPHALSSSSPGSLSAPLSPGKSSTGVYSTTEAETLIISSTVNLGFYHELA